jgi:periplasmic protein TonB
MNCATSNATTITAEPAVSFVPARPSPPGRFRTELLSVATLVLWLGCAVVGGLGLTLSYARPMPGLAEAAPVQAEILEVQLADATFSAPEFDPSPADTVLAQPPALEPMPSPSTVSMLAVAEPTPLVAFPLPVEGPVRLVAPDLAAYAPMRSRADLDAGPAPVLQVINHGHGEGRQPAPEYPRLALREGQEGIVTVRFSVAENGRVLAAEPVRAAPWPLLNDAALRAIKERWRFRPGPVRLYEVAIRFELKR